jgi:hypothetical protein
VSQDESAEVVPPTGRDEAQRRLAEWLRETGLDARALGDDLLLDVIRWGDGRTRHRYCVRRSALPRT